LGGSAIRVLECWDEKLEVEEEDGSISTATPGSAAVAVGAAVTTATSRRWPAPSTSSTAATSREQQSIAYKRGTRDFQGELADPASEVASWDQYMHVKEILHDRL
jgi:hypothetical protein